VTAPVVVLDKVDKTYPRWTPGERSIRSILHRRLPAVRRFGEQRYVLRGISLTAMPGESVGIIGANGAGKSTLLRLVSGLAHPTRGRIEVPGNTASVLTLGDAFALEQSGSENAITGAIIGGLRRSEALAALPAIIEFAELERFADAPMRTYSEGMKLRLAFGIIAQLRPELLVLDEVIAVGDLRFQAKCTGRIREMREDGTTLLFASHSLGMVAEECDRAVWIHEGRIRKQGSASEVIGDYREAMETETLARTPGQLGPRSESHLVLGKNRIGSQEVTIEKVRIFGSAQARVGRPRTGEPLTVLFSLHAQQGPPAPPIVTVSVYRHRDTLACWDLSTERDGVALPVPDPETEMALEITHLDLLPGEYILEIGCFRDDWAYAYDYHRMAYHFTIDGDAQEAGVSAPLHGWSERRHIALRDIGEAPSV
jgi:lipopolysaccharide transport system ATP-binding protein